MNITNVKSVPETLRVSLEDGFYVLIMSKENENCYRDFWLFHEGYGVGLYMLGCTVTSYAEALEIIKNNVDMFVDEMRSRMEEEV